MEINPDCSYTITIETYEKRSWQPPWSRPTRYEYYAAISGSKSFELKWVPVDADLQELTALLSSAYDRDFLWANKSYYGSLVLVAVSDRFELPPFTTSTGQVIPSHVWGRGYDNPQTINHPVLLRANIIQVTRNFCQRWDTKPDWSERIIPPPAIHFTRNFNFTDNRNRTNNISVTFNRRSGGNNVSFSLQNNFVGTLGGAVFKQNNNFNINFNAGNGSFSIGGNNTTNFNNNNGDNSDNGGGNSVDNDDRNPAPRPPSGNDSGTTFIIPVGLGFVYAPIELSGELNIPVTLDVGVTFNPPPIPEGNDIERPPVRDSERKMVRIDIKSEYDNTVGLKFLEPQNRTYPEFGFWAWEFEGGNFSEWDDIRENEISLLIPKTAKNLRLYYTKGKLISTTPYYQSESS